MPSKNNFKKQKAKYDSIKKASELAKYNKQNDYFYDETVCVSLPVKVDETGRFSVFMEMTLIPGKINRREQNKYVKWRLKNVKNTFNPTYDINKPDKKINSLYSALDHNKIRPTKVLSSRLVALNESKKYEIYINTEYNYLAKMTQWHFTRFIPLSGALMWFFRTTSGFSKNAKIGKVIFDCVIEHKELFLGPSTPPNNETDNEYEYFGNGEVVFDNYEQNLIPDIVIID